MFAKPSASNMRFFIPIMLASLLLAACGEKSSSSGNPISVEGVVISSSGKQKDKQAIDQFLSEKKAQTQKLSAIFSRFLKGHLALDPTHTVKFNSIATPSLTLDGKSLVNDLSYTNRLSMEMPGAVATIFVKSGDEFVRIATSLKKQTGQSAATHEENAVGSSLTHKSPAYKACMAGDTYTGTTTLVGSPYMTEYTPIKTTSGTVIGIRFVGIDISSDLVLLKRKLEV